MEIAERYRAVNRNESTLAFSGFMFIFLLLGILLTRPDAGAAAADHLGRLSDPTTPQPTRYVFLPAIMRPPPTPTPTATPTQTPSPTSTATPMPTATPSPTRTPQTLNPVCWWFPLGPSDSDDVECSPTNGLVIKRYNTSFTLVACCGTEGAKHYAISVEAAKTAGDGDYRIGFDVRSLRQGGGYLFGINSDTRSYSLYRIDDGDWKGGVPLIPWTFSETILPGSQFNLMQVERRGPDILLTINGQQVADVQDTTWLDQGIGWILYARNYAGAAEMQYERIRYSWWNDTMTR
jgi:hypothetical protein